MHAPPLKRAGTVIGTRLCITLELTIEAHLQKSKRDREVVGNPNCEIRHSGLSLIRKISLHGPVAGIPHRDGGPNPRQSALFQARLFAGVTLEMAPA